jgi:formamidopyrimidine-DNA glycosylase
MPELPEVETVRRQVEPEVRGKRIDSLRVLDERWTRPVPPAEVEHAVGGRRVHEVSRRGKYLLLELDDGSALVMHLRMTGNLQLHHPGDPEARFLRAVIRLEDGLELWFTDARRFGHATVLAAGEIEPYFAERLGVEPLSGDLTPERLAELAAGLTAPLKSFLLTQTRIAGIGNIYADEALWRAELHPLSPAGSLKPEHCEALVRGVVDSLELALSKQGSSIDDYRDARGERGSMQDEFLVHTREGEECHRCGAEIRRIVIGGRSSYFCSGCQKRLRRRPRRRTRARAPA